MWVTEPYKLVTTAYQSCACIILAHSGAQELCSCFYLVYLKKKAHRHVSQGAFLTNVPQALCTKIFDTRLQIRKEL